MQAQPVIFNLVEHSSQYLTVSDAANHQILVALQVIRIKQLRI